MNLANCRSLTSVYPFSQFMVKNLKLYAIPVDNSYRKPYEATVDCPFLLMNVADLPLISWLVYATHKASTS